MFAVAMQQQIRNEFEQKHGEHILVDGMYLFADGARMERPNWGCTFDPPTDPLQLAKLKRKFCQVKRDRAVRAFDDLKSVLKLGPPAAQIVNSVFVGPDPVARLTELRDAVVVWERRLAEAEQAYQSQNPPERQAALDDVRRALKLAEYRKSIDAISI